MERMERVHGEREAQRQLPPRHRVFGTQAGAFPGTASGSSCSPPCNSGCPTTRSGNGAGSGPRWSTCASCTWRRPPWRPQWRPQWTARWRCLLETGRPFDYAEVRDLAEPKPPEAPALTLTGLPDLKVYDSLLRVNLAVAGVCG